MQFKDVIGQDIIKTRLTNEVRQNRVSHAQLLSGSPGVGKLPIALAYARFLLCEHPAEHDACGTCHSCNMMDKLVHPDLHFVFPTVRKTACDDLLKVWRECVLKNPYFDYEDWLSAIDAKNAQPVIYSAESDTLMRKLSLKSFEGGYKVAIIYFPEKMQEQCANKLLKLIEEPPQKTVFLLVSDEPDKILPTIQSRTQQVSIPLVPEDTLSSMLQTKYGIDIYAAQRIAHLAGGSVSAAIKHSGVTTDGETEQYFNLFVSLMRLAYQRKTREMKQWSEQIAAMGRERQKSFVEYALRLIRESFIYNLRHPQLNYMTDEEEQFVSRFCPFVNEKNIEGISMELNAALSDVERNVNSKIVFFDFALKMIMLLKN